MNDNFLINKIPQINSNQLKFILSIILFISFYISPSMSQSLSDLGSTNVVEMETAQSPITGTFVSVLMERKERERSVIYRSINEGSTWELRDSIEGNGMEDIPDPVICVDDSGVFYLVVMRMTRSPTKANLEMYNSTDDGISWNLVSTPSTDEGLAFYPQIMANSTNGLFLTYTIRNPSNGASRTPVFKKSDDGGQTWQEPFKFPNPNSRIVRGMDITIGKENIFHITYGVAYDSIRYYLSMDNGDTWQNAIQLFNGEGRNHITKPIANPSINHFGIISHQPQRFIENLDIVYHAYAGEEWQSYKVGTGAHPQALITDDGVLHLIYNEIKDSIFSLKYITSNDNGANFSNPIALYSGIYEHDEGGEYQSLLLGQDDKFYLTFCDWSQHSKAMMLVFDSNIITSNESVEEENDAYFLFPNPVKDKVTIQLKNNQVAQKLQVLTVSGKLLLEEQLNRNTTEHTLNLSFLSSGAYLIRLQEQNRIIVKKIIKQ